MDKTKKISVISVFALFLFGFLIAHFLLPDKDISTAERKELAQVPTLSSQAVFNGNYFQDLETYLLDQFPLRGSFVDAKSWIDETIFRKENSSGYAGDGGHLTKLDPTLNESDIELAISKLNDILQSHPQIENAYYAVIPDKNYYMYYKTDSDQPTMDYDKLFEMMKQLNAEGIDLRELLTLDDFYRTDSHWRQERLQPIVNALCAAMGTSPADISKYQAHRLEGFRGVYYELADTPPETDTLTYLTSDTIDGAVVNRLNDFGKWESITAYNEANFGLENKDSYDVFLEGTQMMITIENPNATSDKHLIMFRDSYASSLTPLLIASYAKITLIDIRYISPKLLDQFVDFEGADVLCLYSTTMLNTAGRVFK